MKTISVLSIGLSLLFYCMTGFCNSTTDDRKGVQTNTTSANTINILSSPELNGLTTDWVSEYGRVNTAIKITIGTITNNKEKVGSNLNFISNEYSEAINDGTNWKMIIGRDAIVPIINAKNPMLNEIYRQGISAEKLAQLFVDPEKPNWRNLIRGGQDEVVKCYIIDNDVVNNYVANFTNTNSVSINSIPVSSASEIISSVKKDLYAIGFCKLTDVRNASSNDLMQDIKLLPIDKNANGRIDNFENIYANMNAFTRGVWIGKYPKALCMSIYAISSSKPTDKNTLSFLTWVTTEGQKFLNQNGYSYLASTEVKSNIDALVIPEIAIAASDNKFFISRAWQITLVVFFIVGLMVIGVVRYLRNQVSTESADDVEIKPALNENSILAPNGLYFGKTHTWAFMEKDGSVKVGIDDFLQHITGTITRINLKDPGEIVRKGEKILTIIRDGKQLNIYSPISGTITEQNQTLKSDSSLLNTAPFSEGWVYMIEPKNWLREIRFLLMGENYKEWIVDEFSRLKDFFAASVRSNTAVYAHIILQDGGELTDNVLADLGPEVWEDFQTKFIDTSK